MTHPPIDALEPCRFCENQVGTCQTLVDKKWCVECDECDLITDRKFDTEAEAVAYWNGATIQSLPGVEGLEAAIEFAELEGWVEYGIDGGEEIKNKQVIGWHKAIIEAAKHYASISKKEKI